MDRHFDSKKQTCLCCFCLVLLFDVVCLLIWRQDLTILTSNSRASLSFLPPPPDYLVLQASALHPTILSSLVKAIFAGYRILKTH